MVCNVSLKLKLYYDQYDTTTKLMYCNGYYYMFNYSGVSICSDKYKKIYFDNQSLTQTKIQNLQDQQTQGTIITLEYIINQYQNQSYFNYLIDNQLEMKQILKNNNLEQSQLTLTIYDVNSTQIFQQQNISLVDVSNYQLNYIPVTVIILVFSIIDLGYYSNFIFNEDFDITDENFGSIYTLHQKIGTYFQLLYIGELYFKVSNLYTVSGLNLILFTINYLLFSIIVLQQLYDQLNNNFSFTDCRIFCLLSISLIIGYVIISVLFVYKQKIGYIGTLVIYTVFNSFNVTRIIYQLCNINNFKGKKQLYQQISKSLTALGIFYFVFGLQNAYQYNYNNKNVIIIGISCSVIPCLISICLELFYKNQFLPHKNNKKINITEYLNTSCVNKLLQQSNQGDEKVKVFFQIHNVQELQLKDNVNEQLKEQILRINAQININKKKLIKHFQQTNQIGSCYLSKQILEIPCGICLDPIQLNQPCFLEYQKVKQQQQQNIYFTNCGHIYHKKCLQNWLNDHNDCPACRQILLQ